MEYWLTRFCFQRAVAFIYLIGFLIVVNQFKPLCGEKGLLPAPRFLEQVSFRDAPSLFHLKYSDSLATALGWLGVALSLFALSGWSDRLGFVPYLLTWGLLWVLYLSYVNVGQTFYGFGWETLLLETGFLTIFLGPAHTTPPVIVIWLFRWLLFRLMFGAGLIKLRGDECWRDMTCMYYHYETQPLPNPVSWYLHHLPKPLHRLEVWFTHFCEIVVPWFYFIPGVLGWVAAGITIFFQAGLVVSGNLSWLNYITIVLCIPCFDDRLLSKILPISAPTELVDPLPHQISVWLVSALILYLSYRPAKNLVSPNQMMNASFDSLHLVNTYGAFGGITRERMEVVIQGTRDEIDADTRWEEYEFKGKPGDPMRRPCLVSPYHYKIDWQMWFAAMSPYWHHPWILNLTAKLLRNDQAMLSLIEKNPFPEQPPKHIRMELYRYRFTQRGEKGWWHRTREAAYLPPVALDDPEFKHILEQMRWN